MEIARRGRGLAEGELLMAVLYSEAECAEARSLRYALQEWGRLGKSIITSLKFGSGDKKLSYDFEVN